VYAPAVKKMAINGPSLLPGVIPSDYSRGHPLFFHFLCGLWIRCFGNSNIALHSFPLLITVVFLIALYEGCRRMFNAKVATLALLLVTTQAIFFVQASFVELEMMVALLTFLALYFYAYDKLLLTSLMLAMLFLTKEAGLVFGLVIGLHAMIVLFDKKQPLSRRLLRVFAVGVSVVPVALFFVLQKAREGWYLLPLHNSLINTDWDHMYFMFRECLHWIFESGNPTKLLWAFIIALSAVPAIKHKNIRYLFLCLPAAIVWILTNKEITGATGDVVWVVLFGLFFIAGCYGLLHLNKKLDEHAKRFIILLSLGFVAYLCFSSLSVLTFRYLLVEIVLLLIFLAVCIDMFITASAHALYPISIVGILLVGVCAYNADSGNDDTDLEAFHAMKVQKAVVAYLEKENAYDKEVTMGCFWETVHLIDTTQGFLSSGRVFTKINWDTAGANTDYAVFDNVCSSSTYERMVQNPAFHLAYRIKDGRTWSEVYKRQTPAP
jgi:hypothetical protein